jgi:hypothetical protein
MTLIGRGTITADGTVQLLQTTSSAGIFVFIVDKINMQSGDQLALTINTQVLSTGPMHAAYSATFFNAAYAGDIIAYSVPVPVDTVATFTLQQAAGTYRNFDYKILAL